MPENFNPFNPAHVAAFRSLDPDSLSGVEILDPDTIRGESDAVDAVLELVVDALPESDDTAHGLTFAAWLTAAGRSDSSSLYDLRVAWRAGEDPAEYTI